MTEPTTPTGRQAVALAGSAWPEPYYHSPDGLAWDILTIEQEAREDERKMVAAKIREVVKDVTAKELTEWLLR